MAPTLTTLETKVPQEYTPTERRMLDVLSDGMMHRREELHACLSDNLSQMSTIQFHVSNLRAKVQPRGQDIVCVIYKGGIYYRHVVILPKAGDGKR